MKSLKELEEIRNRVQKQMDTRKTGSGTRIVVGMATCGISAGARPVLKAFMDEAAARELTNVEIGQTGCVGLCSLEPIVEVYKSGDNKVTYGKVTPEVARRIMAEHIVNGNVVNEYTVGSLEQNNN